MWLPTSISCRQESNLIWGIHAGGSITGNLTWCFTSLRWLELRPQKGRKTRLEAQEVTSASKESLQYSCLTLRQLLPGSRKFTYYPNGSLINPGPRPSCMKEKQIINVQVVLWPHYIITPILLIKVDILDSELRRILIRSFHGAIEFRVTWIRGNVEIKIHLFPKHLFPNLICL